MLVTYSYFDYLQIHDLSMSKQMTTFLELRDNALFNLVFSLTPNVEEQVNLLAVISSMHLVVRLFTNYLLVYLLKNWHFNCFGPLSASALSPKSSNLMHLIVLLKTNTWSTNVLKSSLKPPNML